MSSTLGFVSHFLWIAIIVIVKIGIFSVLLRKQLHRGVLLKGSCEIFCKIHWKASVSKASFDKIACNFTTLIMTPEFLLKKTPPQVFLCKFY